MDTSGWSPLLGLATGTLTLEGDELVQESSIYYWLVSKAKPGVLLLQCKSELPEGLVNNLDSWSLLSDFLF